MGRVDDTKTDEELKDAETEASMEVSEPREVVRVGEDVEQGTSPTQLGATRYVMAGFFTAAIAVAYVAGRAVSAGWSSLANAQWAVDKAPWLTQVGEEARGTYGTVAGGVIALGLLLYVYRREDIRTWVNEAAAELAKVSWPNKKEVTNGTVVVIVASIIATFYFMLLDRFWGFVTDLVYRA